MTVRYSQKLSVEDFVGDSSAVQQLREHLSRLSSCAVNVVLHGESGTGKELAARILHETSARRDGPFVGVNCASVHESLLESVLFGHQAGAFTGATGATLGFLRAADGGTILLDEVGDMSGPLQSKLLRALEERAVVPVGGTQPIPVDIRVIAATHRDLTAAVREGTFRQDLYYRLNVVCLTIPPLRERRSDIPLLARHMLETISDALSMSAKQLSRQAMVALVRYDWPGNVRELGNVIQRAYVLGRESRIQIHDLPESLIHNTPVIGETFPTLDQLVSRHVGEALTRSGGVRNRAAAMLGINRKRLYRMMRHSGIS
ncbi:hypothetical protein LCGC14_1493710 [marine sediment metagenome]|uniref:Sigma-54 factor interaction domain-containing protein n=1 Tax=marine sediment metagenome TaxID=412755 RepID=A0A0F9J6L4_9ZZZZ